MKISIIAMHILLYLVDIVWYRPLYNVYRKGPVFSGIGFWGSLADEDVCSRLTGTGSSHWINNKIECDKIIHEDFHQWTVLIDFSVYMYTTIQLISFAAHVLSITICNYIQLKNKTTSYIRDA